MSTMQQPVQMMVLATACDENGATTGLFIVSSPTPHTHNNAVGVKESELFHDCLDTIMQDPPQAGTTVEPKTASLERPKKGILKPAKAISYEALALLPPPIQRSARLSPRELRRLTPLPPPSPPASQSTDSPKQRHHPRVSFVAAATLTSLHDAHSTDEYNRGACDFAARSLTPQLALLIKKELNEVKAEMEVHEESREHTQFYKI